MGLQHACALSASNSNWLLAVTSLHITKLNTHLLPLHNLAMSSGGAVSAKAIMLMNMTIYIPGCVGWPGVRLPL